MNHPQDFKAEGMIISSKENGEQLMKNVEPR